MAVVSLATSIEVARERPELRGILAAAISQHVMAAGALGREAGSDGGGGSLIGSDNGSAPIASAAFPLGGTGGSGLRGGPRSDPRPVRLMLGCLERLRR